MAKLHARGNTYPKVVPPKTLARILSRTGIETHRPRIIKWRHLQPSGAPHVSIERNPLVPAPNPRLVVRRRRGPRLVQRDRAGQGPVLPVLRWVPVCRLRRVWRLRRLRLLQPVLLPVWVRLWLCLSSRLRLPLRLWVLVRPLPELWGWLRAGLPPRRLPRRLPPRRFSRRRVPRRRPRRRISR